MPDLKDSKISQIPYLGFPITQRCVFSCIYCRPGGETHPGCTEDAQPARIIEAARVAHSLGTRKFRITGGEPFFHKQLGTIVNNLAKLPETQVVVNTTGAFIRDWQGVVSSTPDNVKFIVGLDAIDKTEFNKIKRPRAGIVYEKVIETINILAARKILKRLNVVATPYNYKSFYKILDYCRKLGCDLKIADAAKNINQYNNLGNIYIPLDKFEKELEEKASKIEQHKYTKQFGIPCNIYHIDGVKVTIKNSQNGSRYNLKGPCGDCSGFPCQEGLYFISYLPDGSFSGCRLNKIFIQNRPSRPALIEMNKILKGAQLIKGKA